MAILKLNGEDLLKTKDDGGFLVILKRFFTTLDEPIDTSGKSKAKLTVSDSMNKKLHRHNGIKC